MAQLTLKSEPAFGVPGRRSLAFDPTGIANLWAWWDFSKLALADGAGISSFADSGPVGNNLTQSTGSKQPLCKLGRKNGLSCAVWDTTPDDNLRLVSDTLIGKNQTYFFAFKFPANKSSGYMVLVQNGINYPLYLNSNNLNFSANSGGGSVSDGGMVAATWYLVTITRVGTALVWRKNGSQLGTATMGANDDMQIRDIGGSQNVPGWYSPGLEVGEILIYLRGLTDTEIGKVERYLNAKWAIY